MTVVAGRGRFPRDPAVVLAAIAVVVLAAGQARAEVVARARVVTHEDPSRLDGLMDALSWTRVVGWNDDRLVFRPGTDTLDVALRVAAYLGTRPVVQAAADPLRALAAEIGRLAGEAARQETLVPSVTESMPTKSAEETPVPRSDLKIRLSSLLTGLDDAFKERSVVVRMSLLTLMAGQHVLLLGPPGTAKSAFARALCACFEGATFFEYLLTRFTHPDELFGPVSIEGLKTSDYRRLTEGHLPTAQIAFLDEVFKANSAILNSLLAVVNERTFHHGKHIDRVPLIGLVAASNEVPDPEAGLAALYDRFLCRLSVPPLTQQESWWQVASGNLRRFVATTALRQEDLESVGLEADRVQIPPSVAEALGALWRIGLQEGWAVSDRRWQRVVALLRLAAATDGRDAVDTLDLLMLPYMLAPSPDRSSEVLDAVIGLVKGVGPEDDLAAQWLLLRADRVAPVDPHSVVDSATPAGFPARLERRRRELDRFLEHHKEAVFRLAAIRRAMEAAASTRLWIDTIPSAWMARIVHSTRDLARVAEVAARYRTTLVDTPSAAAGLLGALPAAPRRSLGVGVVLALTVGEGAPVRLTLAGERDDAGTPDPLDRPHELRVSPEWWVAWVEGKVDDALVRQVVPHAQRNVATALVAVRRHLAGSAVPPPPDLQ